MKLTLVAVIFFLCNWFICSFSVQAQGELQPGRTIERTISRGQLQRFSITLEKGQYLQLAVEQKGIDVVIRVMSPEGRLLGEFDSPNGDEGLESVTIISTVAGVYYVDVTPLAQVEEVVTGNYDIRIVELRRATDQELQSDKNLEVLKARGVALMTKLAETLPEIRLVHTRVRAETQAARLLWGTDEKLAAKLIADAIAGVREFIEKVDASDQDYYQNYNIARELRQEVLQVLAPYDPEGALNFMRSTRQLPNPEQGPYNNEQELRFEIGLANQIAAKDPKRALQIAEDTLKGGYTASLADTVRALQATNPDLAVELAKEIQRKLLEEKLLGTSEAGNLAVNLLRLAHSPGPRASSNGTPADPPLLSEQEYRDLFTRTLTAGLGFTPATNNFYSYESNSARNIVNSLRSMTTEMNSYAPGSLAVAEKKNQELNTPPDPQNRVWQQYQEKINNNTVDVALESVSQAPPEAREQLYQQIAGKAASDGDLARARQIVTEHITNPLQRQQALRNLDNQAIYSAINKGRSEEALRLIGNIRNPRERASMLGQVASQIGPGQKRAAVLNLLEQMRAMVGASPQAEDQEQMNALLQISLAFSRYDPKRAFEVIEPLLDQFNELGTAAQTLNGFGQQYYQEGELILQNGNSVANVAQLLIQAFGRLAITDFERAKTDVDRLQRPEVRITALLSMAQQMINPPLNGIRFNNRRFVE
jgi:hypothetical protein